MENIFVRVYWSPQDIQIYIELFREFCDVFSSSYEEMPEIDPRIVEHEITNYPDVNPIWQKNCPINPRKETTIKAQVKKIIKAGFIYPMQMT